MKHKLFGTDGIRGEAGRYPITPEFFLKLGKVVGILLMKSKNTKKKVLIGQDTRISGSMLIQAFSSGICSLGFDVYNVGVIPTPAVCYLTKKMNFDIGIVISASHNPFYYNGIKFFNNKGFKLDDKLENKIENYVTDKNFNSFFTGKIGKTINVNYMDNYLNFIRKNIDNNLPPLKVVVDCANGAVTEYSKRLFKDVLKLKTVFINDKPDGFNINKKCGSLHTESVTNTVLKYKADVGFAFDGDADRVIVSDEKGDVINGDDILGICARFTKSKTIVGTIMSNIALEKFINSLGMKFERAKVGDKFVLEKMLKEKALLGGEASGHIIFLDKMTTGDGLITSACILNIMQHTGKSLSSMREFKRYTQIMNNVRIKKRKNIEDMKCLQDVIKDVKNTLGNNGRVVFRFSGTEPVARVMLEGKEHRVLEGHLHNIVKAVKKECG